MKTHNDNQSASATFKAPRTRRRWLAAAALVLAAGGAGATFASGGPGLAGHHGRGAHAAMDPAAMDAYIGRMVEQFAADSSPDQKQRVASIAKAAIADLRPVHAQFGQGHARAHELLMAPVIDRAALEQLRVEQMQRMDFMSRRVLAAVEDASEVLTLEQRAKFAGHLKMYMH